MEQNKQVTGGGEPLSASSRRRIVKPVLLVVVTALIAGAVLLVLHSNPSYLKASRSNSLISKVDNLEKHGQCDSGIKQVSPASPHLGDSAYYSDTARERALTYLMGCSVIIGKNNDALNYGGQLSSLYSKEHDSRKLHKNQQFIDYVKGLSQ